MNLHRIARAFAQFSVFALHLSAAMATTTSALASEVHGLTIETGSPDALCPELERTREVVARRLGALVVEGHSGWRARYTIGHAPSGSPRDFVRLELFNSEGVVELLRDLPIEGESCRTMAEVIALVLDRHFRGLPTKDGHAEAVPPEQRSAPFPREPRRPIAAPAVAAVMERPVPDSPPDGDGGKQGRPVLLGLHLAESFPNSRPNVGLRALFPAPYQLFLGTVVALDLGEREQTFVGGGGAQSLRMSGRVFLARVFQERPWLGYVGPSASTALERGSVSRFTENNSAVRAVTSLGIDAGLLIDMGRRWHLSAAAFGQWRVPFASGRFTVGDDEVLTPPSVEFGWGAGIAYAFGDGP